MLDGIWIKTLTRFNALSADSKPVFEIAQPLCDIRRMMVIPP
jgi:hypothetical protein